VAVDAAQIARSLLVQMLFPLGLGLLANARYPESAAHLLPIVGQASSISLIFVFVLMVALNFGNLIGLFGSGGLLAVLLLTLVALAVGYGLGTSTDTKRVLGLGTGQRNLAAAFVVATGNFADQPDVTVLLAAAGLAMLVILMPVAGEFGKRTRPSPSVVSTREL
jgi:BASS family bile acid:Na+ symporter